MEAFLLYCCLFSSIFHLILELGRELTIGIQFEVNVKTMKLIKLFLFFFLSQVVEYTNGNQLAKFVSLSSSKYMKVGLKPLASVMLLSLVTLWYKVCLIAVKITIDNERGTFCSHGDVY